MQKKGIGILTSIIQESCLYRNKKTTSLYKRYLSTQETDGTKIQKATLTEKEKLPSLQEEYKYFEDEQRESTLSEEERKEWLTRQEKLREAHLRVHSPDIDPYIQNQYDTNPKIVIHESKWTPEQQDAAKKDPVINLRSDGRASLHNRYYGRGYQDQYRSLLTGQTIHEHMEALRRIPEPIEGHCRIGGLYGIQAMDPEHVRYLYTIITIYFFIIIII